MLLGTELGLGLSDIVLGPSSLSPKGAQPPNFRPMSVVAKRLDELRWHLVWSRPQPRRLCVRCGRSCPQRKGHTDPTQFLAHVFCGQTAGWINMPLGTEVNVGPGDVVLDGVAAPPKRRTPPVFGSCLLWPNGWMDEDATWYGSIPRPLY